MLAFNSPKTAALDRIPWAVHIENRSHPPAPASPCIDSLHGGRPSHDSPRKTSPYARSRHKYSILTTDYAIGRCLLGVWSRVKRGVDWKRVKSRLTFGNPRGRAQPSAPPSWLQCYGGSSNRNAAISARYPASAPFTLNMQLEKWSVVVTHQSLRAIASGFR
jgi:hypothetical protein